MVSRLATFLRLRLEPSPTQLSSFERELEATRAYLDIEHTRFGDALTATYDIAPESLAWQVPELILQPLVENAVKYGFENDCQLEIQIQSRVNHGILTITVSNRGTLPPKNEPPVGFGIGIHNIRQRLTMHYGAQATFQLSQQGENVVALLLIPKL
jgi:two-component system sensor histidine kinase LytS